MGRRSFWCMKHRLQAEEPTGSIKAQDPSGGGEPRETIDGGTYGSVEAMEDAVARGSMPRDGSATVKYEVNETSKAPLVPPVVMNSGATPSPARAPDVPAKRFRVVGLTAPKTYVERAGLGKTCTMRPNKVLDSRHYDVDFIRSQGFELVEVTDERKIGVVR
jgi:hypothetical protein